MSRQPSTSRTVPSNTATTELPAVTATMFAGIPSVPTSSQLLDRAHTGSILTVWFIPVCSSGIVSGSSYVESQQIGPSGCQFGQSGPQGQTIPLSTGLPPYGG